MASIILAALENMEAAVALLEAQLQEHDIATSASALREVVRAVVSDPRHGFILLAFENDEAVGVAYAAAHLSAEHGGLVGWLEEIYVRPTWRSRGLGAALLSEVAERAERLGWRGLELEVVQGHERAVPLYSRHQFLPLARARFSRRFDR